MKHYGDEAAQLFQEALDETEYRELIHRQNEYKRDLSRSISRNIGISLIAWVAVIALMVLLSWSLLVTIGVGLLTFVLSVVGSVVMARSDIEMPEGDDEGIRQKVIVKKVQSRGHSPLKAKKIYRWHVSKV